jgi:precorrin-6Y C5,15-methyltransferase (decarboxylating) CbiT subunit
MKMGIITPGIPDSQFIRGKVPMTKEEVRSLSLCKLRLREDDVLLDIGAGTGSISIEAAMLLKKGMVHSIERKVEAVELIKKISLNLKLKILMLLKDMHQRVCQI